MPSTSQISRWAANFRETGSVERKKYVRSVPKSAKRLAAEKKIAKILAKDPGRWTRKIAAASGVSFTTTKRIIQEMTDQDPKLKKRIQDARTRPQQLRSGDDDEEEEDEESDDDDEENDGDEE